MKHSSVFRSGRHEVPPRTPANGCRPTINPRAGTTAEWMLFGPRPFIPLEGVVLGPIGAGIVLRNRRARGSIEAVQILTFRQPSTAFGRLPTEAFFGWLAPNQNIPRGAGSGLHVRFGSAENSCCPLSVWGASRFLLLYFATWQGVLVLFFSGRATRQSGRVSSGTESRLQGRKSQKSRRRCAPPARSGLRLPIDDLQDFRGRIT